MANMSIEELIEEIEVYVDNCKTAGVLSSGSMIKINREELLAMRCAPACQKNWQKAARL